MMNTEELKQYATIGIIIIFGACANVLQLFLQQKEETNTFPKYLANFLLASFGWLIAWLVAKLIISDYVRIMIVSWIGGYAGVAWLNKLKDVLIDTLLTLVKKKNE